MRLYDMLRNRILIKTKTHLSWKPAWRGGGRGLSSSSFNHNLYFIILLPFMSQNNYDAADLGAEKYELAMTLVNPPLLHCFNQQTRYITLKTRKYFHTNHGDHLNNYAYSFIYVCKYC